MKEFLVENWQFISTALLTVVCIILALAKKKPVNQILDNSAYKDLIILIKQAEEKFGSGHGKDKLDYVITSFCNLKSLDRDTFLKCSIQSKVENILATPERKEKK